MLKYKETKLAAQEISITLSRDENGELKPQECYARLVNNRYLGADGGVFLGDTYLNFVEVPVEIIGQLDAALVALYESQVHIDKLKEKPQLQDAEIVVE